MDRITFKKWDKLTGLTSIGYSNRRVDIKLNGRVIGVIQAPNWQTKPVWKIKFMVIKYDINEDSNPNCKYKWIKVKQEFDTEKDARQYIKYHTANILKLNFHYLE
jgi:hypothetical protein